MAQADRTDIKLQATYYLLHPALKRKKEEEEGYSCISGAPGCIPQGFGVLTVQSGMWATQFIALTPVTASCSHNGMCLMAENPHFANLSYLRNTSSHPKTLNVTAVTAENPRVLIFFSSFALGIVTGLWHRSQKWMQK